MSAELQQLHAPEPPRAMTVVGIPADRRPAAPLPNLDHPDRAHVLAAMYAFAERIADRSRGEVDVARQSPAHVRELAEIVREQRDAISAWEGDHAALVADLFEVRARLAQQAEMHRAARLKVLHRLADALVNLVEQDHEIARLRAKLRENLDSAARVVAGDLPPSIDEFDAEPTR